MLRIFSTLLISNSFIIICFAKDLSGLNLFGDLLSFINLDVPVSPQIWKVLHHYSFQQLFVTFSLFSLSRNPVIPRWINSIHNSQRLSSVFFFFFFFFALLSSDLVTSNDLSSASQITYSKLMFPSAFSFHSWYSSALEFLFFNYFSVLNFFSSCVVFLNAFEWTFWGFGSPLCFPQVIAVVPWTRGFGISGPIHIGVCFFVF